MYKSDKATTAAASSKLTRRMQWGSNQDKQLAALFKDNIINQDLPHFNNKQEESAYLLDKSLNISETSSLKEKRQLQCNMAAPLKACGIHCSSTSRCEEKKALGRGE